jgi:hypothetical protein
MGKKITVEEQAKNAVLWINRLATTRVKQGVEELGDSESGYCCLGYGCKILNVPYNPSNVDSDNLADKIGLISSMGEFDTPLKYDSINEASMLTELNDEAKYSFRRISTVIKSRVGEIFEPKVAILIKKELGL